MRRAVYVSIMLIALVLGACNTKDVDESQGSSDVLYTHGRELKQNFEGVKLTMTYVIRDAGEMVHIDLTSTLVNGFSSMVYYTPTFIVEDQNKVQYEGQRVQELSVAPENELTFTETIALPLDVYESSEFIRFFVPAVFTQSGSTSSGDALGDTVWWELPLK